MAFLNAFSLLILGMILTFKTTVGFIKLHRADLSDKAAEELLL